MSGRTGRRVSGAAAGACSTALLGLLAAACSAGGIASPPPARATGPAITFVAIGGTETFEQGRGDAGRDGWADIVYRSDFGEAATFYDLSAPDETVSEALAGLAPETVSLRPAVAAVVLGSADALAGTPVPAYARDLTRLVQRLQSGGATRVLLGDVPPLELYPGYPACQGAPRQCGVDQASLPSPTEAGGTISAYNTVTRLVATAQHAQLVELNRPLTAALTDGSLTGGASVAEARGLGLADAGNALVARLFGADVGSPTPPGTNAR